MTTDPTVTRDEKSGKVECTVTFTEDQVGPAEKAAIAELGKEVKVDGFREGQAPAEVLRDKIDPEKLFEATVRSLMPAAFEKLVADHGINPIAPPRVEVTSQMPVTIKVIFLEKPAVKLKGADKIKVEAQKPTVDPKDLDRMVEYVCKQHQVTTEADKAIEEGDKVTMDFWGEDENKQEVAGIRTTGHDVIVGSKVLLPGFEDELKGLKKGDEKSFDLIFPEKHQAEELRGKPVTFHVTITKVETVEIPEFNDAFVKEKLNAESAEAFKKEMETSMLQQEAGVARKATEEQLLEKIREATVVEIPDELAEEEQRQIVEDLAQNLSRQQMGFDDWLAQTGKTAEEFEADLKDQAIKRVTLRLGLAQLMEDKQITVSDDDMNVAVEAVLSPLSEAEREKMSANYQPGQPAYEQLKWQKKVDSLFEELIIS